jgi:ABC-type multidrug transport system fused ATPase/permease subunit
LSEKRELTDGVGITNYSNAWKNNGAMITSLKMPIYLEFSMFTFTLSLSLFFFVARTQFVRYSRHAYTSSSLTKNGGDKEKVVFNLMEGIRIISLFLRHSSNFTYTKHTTGIII